MTAVRLGDLATVFKGRVAAKTVADGDGPRFFGIAEISAHGATAPRYVDPVADLDEAVFLQPGDIVVALLGDIGNAVMVNERAAGAVLGRECAALRVTAAGHVLPSWLYAWTASQEFKSQVMLHTSGTTMPRVSTRAIEDFTLPLPSLDRQRELEQLVDRFDAALTATATALQHMEELRTLEMDLAVAEVCEEQ